MTTCTCLVQTEQISSERRQALQARIREFGDRHLGGACEPQWIEVARGSGYTAGVPSTSSFVSLVAARPLEQARRETLLKQFCEMWSAEAACSTDEILAVLADPL